MCQDSLLRLALCTVNLLLAQLLTKPWLWVWFAVTKSDVHNHVPDDMEARRGILLKRIQERIRRNPTAPVRTSYDRAADEDSEYSGDNLPSFDSVRTRAKRHRARFMPSVPQTVDDVIIRGEWGKTWTGRPFLLHRDNDWGILMFGTARTLSVVRRCQCLFIDGTFRTAPRPYEQLVTVHGLYNGFVIPVVFCLMTGKQ